MKVFTWRDHLKELRKTKEMCAWVSREFITARGYRLAKIMLFFMLLGMIAGMMRPWVFGQLLDALSSNDSQQLLATHLMPLITWAMNILGWQIPSRQVLILMVTMCMLAVVVFAGRSMQKWFMHWRELLLGDNEGRLRERSYALFAEKASGQHEAKSNKLNEANLTKGYKNIHELQGVLLFWGFNALFSILVPYVAIWLLNWYAGIFTSLMLAIYVSWSVFLNQKVFMTMISIDRMWRELKRYVVERCYNVIRVKTCGKEDEELQIIRRKYESVIVPDRKFWLWFIRQIAWRGQINNLILLTLIAFSVHRTYSGDMSIGSLCSLYMWIWVLSDNLWALGHLEHQFNELTPSILAMKEALTMPVGIEVSDNPVTLSPDAPCRIEFCNVSYAYPNTSGDRGRQILNNISFIIEPGQKIALLGPSGVGKTTIIKLLLCFFDPTSGQVLIDGVDLRQLNRQDWLKRIGYVSQRPMILTGSMRYNMTYSYSTIDGGQMDDEQLYRIAQMARADFGDRLTQGFDTLVGWGGVELSGGEQQRLMIAAAIAKRRSLMIIDEATSSLDSRTEKEVQAGLEQVLSGGCSAIVIAHRLSTTEFCDHFLYLNSNGKGSSVIAEAASLEGLAGLVPEFKELMEMQKIVS